ncbi:hypothetical protein QTN25_000575 [Entamoeba marina]
MTQANRSIWYTYINRLHNLDSFIEDLIGVCNESSLLYCGHDDSIDFYNLKNGELYDTLHFSSNILQIRSFQTKLAITFYNSFDFVLYDIENGQKIFHGLTKKPILISNVSFDGMYAKFLMLSSPFIFDIVEIDTSNSCELPIMKDYGLKSLYTNNSTQKNKAKPIIHVPYVMTSQTGLSPYTIKTSIGVSDISFLLLENEIVTIGTTNGLVIHYKIDVGNNNNTIENIMFCGVAEKGFILKGAATIRNGFMFVYYCNSTAQTQLHIFYVQNNCVVEMNTILFNSTEFISVHAHTSNIQNLFYSLLVRDTITTTITAYQLSSIGDILLQFKIPNSELKGTIITTLEDDFFVSPSQQQIIQMTKEKKDICFPFPFTIITKSEPNESLGILQVFLTSQCYESGFQNLELLIKLLFDGPNAKNEDIDQYRKNNTFLDFPIYPFFIDVKSIYNVVGLLCDLDLLNEVCQEIETRGVNKIPHAVRRTLLDEVKHRYFELFSKALVFFDKFDMVDTKKLISNKETFEKYQRVFQTCGDVYSHIVQPQLLTIDIIISFTDCLDILFKPIHIDFNPVFIKCFTNKFITTNQFPIPLKQLLKHTATNLLPTAFWYYMVYIIKLYNIESKVDADILFNSFYIDTTNITTNGMLLYALDHKYYNLVQEIVSVPKPISLKHIVPEVFEYYSDLFLLNSDKLFNGDGTSQYINDFRCVLDVLLSVFANQDKVLQRHEGRMFYLKDYIYNLRVLQHLIICLIGVGEYRLAIDMVTESIEEGKIISVGIQEKIIAMWQCFEFVFSQIIIFKRTIDFLKFIPNSNMEPYFINYLFDHTDHNLLLEVFTCLLDLNYSKIITQTYMYLSKVVLNDIKSLKLLNDAFQTYYQQLETKQKVAVDQLLNQNVIEKLPTPVCLIFLDVLHQLTL